LIASFLRRPSHLSRTSLATGSAGRSKLVRKAPRQGSKVAQLTLPDEDHLPTRNFKFKFRSLVARNVTLKLALPELRTGLGGIGQPAVVPVPEAAVHKKGNAPAPKDDIRLSRKVPGMEPKSVAHRVQEPTNGHLRSRVTAPDATHKGAAPLPAHDVEPHTRLASALNRW
jgi:hypothetical protein